MTRPPFAAFLLASVLAVALHAHAEPPAAVGETHVDASAGACEACAALHAAPAPPTPLSASAAPFASAPAPAAASSQVPCSAPAGAPAPRGPPVTLS